MKDYLKNFLANSEGQGLLQHSVAVGKIAGMLMEASLDPNCEDKESLINAARFVGCFHDIGKVSKEHQDWISNEHCRKLNNAGEPKDEKSYKERIAMFHQELSWMFCAANASISNRYSMHRKCCLSSIFWHHGTYRGEREILNLRTNEMYKNVLKQDSQVFYKMKDFAEAMLEEIERHFPQNFVKYVVENLEIQNSLHNVSEFVSESHPFPLLFPENESVKLMSLLVINFVTKADRIVSESK